MSNKVNLEEVNIIISNLEMFFICIFTYYIALKTINSKESLKNKVLIIFICCIISAIRAYIKSKTNFLESVICLILMLSLTFSKFQKKDVTYSMMIIVFSLSINYIMLILSSAISYFPNAIMKTQNDYISFAFVIIFYTIFVYGFTKIKRFKSGLIIFKSKLDNEYFNLIILNISMIVIFLFIALSNYKEEITGKLGIGFIICGIMMFITIQKSLQLYYKQKLLIQDLNETKEELEKKKQEVEQLEKENLNFSKTSHSIAHKQKSLEYKLNELMVKSEIASEIDLKDRLNTISKELYSEKAVVELAKTDISEIDDMLKYMQSESIKNKIDFQLQLSGNIHHMINQYVSKENLEILIADHIRNAIIAINYSDNVNKSILVRLGIIDGIYSLYIYDSGIEFETETLLNLGKKPSTTHGDNGGTGMGFMNTFDTLKKYEASMIINEYGKPCKDNYTKLIMFKFDKKNEFKICSYRSEEIKEKDITNSLNIEKINEGLQ